MVSIWMIDMWIGLINYFTMETNIIKHIIVYYVYANYTPTKAWKHTHTVSKHWYNYLNQHFIII